MNTRRFSRSANSASGFNFSWVLPARARTACLTAKSVETISLKAGEIYRLEPGMCHWEIEVLSGCVWITQAGVSGDFIFHAGQNFQSVNDGLIVIEAMADSSITIRLHAPVVEELKAA